MCIKLVPSEGICIYESMYILGRWHTTIKVKVKERI
nr:MAG TPA: hypothetical protein [Caudoviricetes sp.]